MWKTRFGIHTLGTYGKWRKRFPGCLGFRHLSGQWYQYGGIKKPRPDLRNIQWFSKKDQKPETAAKTAVSGFLFVRREV